MFKYSKEVIRGFLSSGNILTTGVKKSAKPNLDSSAVGLL
jgi:hypothetical protein